MRSFCFMQSSRQLLYISNLLNCIVLLPGAVDLVCAFFCTLGEKYFYKNFRGITHKLRHG